jgi:1-deoxy-D-xylulose 5-phosphate reductoisomerase
MQKKRIAIFGSTGSIGTQALDVIRTQLSVTHKASIRIFTKCGGNR